MVLNGAIIQYSMLVPGLNKGGSPLPVEQAHRGEGAVPHLPPLMVRLQEVPPLPFVLLPAVSSSSYYFCSFLRGHVPTLRPEWIWVLAVVTVHFRRRDTAGPGGRCGGGGRAGGVKGLVHPGGTPTSVPDLGCLPPRKINSDKWALLSALTHSRDTSN